MAAFLLFSGVLFVCNYLFAPHLGGHSGEEERRRVIHSLKWTQVRMTMILNPHFDHLSTAPTASGKKAWGILHTKHKDAQNYSAFH